MAEIKTPPEVGYDEFGNQYYAFYDWHTLADIARWLMTNRTDAEEVRNLLTEMLEEQE